MFKFIVSAIAIASVALAAHPARAQQSSEKRSWLQENVPAPNKAVEIAIASGYTQGFGETQRGVGVPSVATPGVGFELGAGYRINPRLSLGAVGQYYELNAERAANARGMTVGLAGTYHFAPEKRMDPWLELGTGYRLLWEVSSVNPDVLTHGFQLARARVGLDIRGAEPVAFAPFVGADANLFLWQDAGSSVAIADPRLNTFIFAGIQGRFDFGGTPVSTTQVTSASARK